jgi:hypothetical protein
MIATLKYLFITKKIFCLFISKMYSNEYNRNQLYRENKPFSSVNDYTTLKDYHHSFFTSPRLSDLRMVISPGSSKFFNQDFKVNFSSNSKRDNQFVQTDFEIIPFNQSEYISRRENNRSKSDYIGYKK